MTRIQPNQNPQNGAVLGVPPTSSASKLAPVAQKAPGCPSQFDFSKEARYDDPGPSDLDAPPEVTDSIVEPAHVRPTPSEREPMSHIFHNQSVRPTSKRPLHSLGKGRVGGGGKGYRRQQKVQVVSVSQIACIISKFLTNQPQDCESLKEVEMVLSTDIDFADILASKITQKVSNMLGCAPTNTFAKASTKSLSSKHGPTRAKQMKAEEKEREDGAERKKNLVSDSLGL